MKGGKISYGFGYKHNNGSEIILKNDFLRQFTLNVSIYGNAIEAVKARTLLWNGIYMLLVPTINIFL